MMLTFSFFALYLYLPENDNMPEIKSPLEFIKIGILSKYHLQSVKCLKFSGKITADGKIFIIQNRDIDISVSDNSELSFAIAFNGIKKRGKKITFIPDDLTKPYELAFKIPDDTMGFQKRKTEGKLEINIVPGINANNKSVFSLKIISELSFEKYIAMTVISETGFEILKNLTDDQKQQFYLGMSTVIRSYALKNIDRHKSDGYHLCDLTHCMHFRYQQLKAYGAKKLVMLNEMNLIHETFFHASCGGQLSGPEILWSSALKSKYYRREKDIDRFGNQYCAGSPHQQWGTNISKKVILNLLKVDDFTSLRTIEKAGRVTALKAKLPSGKTVKIGIANFLSGIGHLLGWNLIKSNFFYVRQLEKDTYYFSGHGLGHGIGLCMWGAAKMSAENKSYKEILNFYYNSPKLVRLR